MREAREGFNIMTERSVDEQREKIDKYEAVSRLWRTTYDRIGDMVGNGKFDDDDNYRKSVDISGGTLSTSWNIKDDIADIVLKRDHEPTIVAIRFPDDDDSGAKVSFAFRVANIGGDSDPADTLEMVVRESSIDGVEVRAAELSEPFLEEDPRVQRDMIDHIFGQFHEHIAPGEDARRKEVAERRKRVAKRMFGVISRNNKKTTSDPSDTYTI